MFLSEYIEHWPISPSIVLGAAAAAAAVSAAVVAIPHFRRLLCPATPILQWGVILVIGASSGIGIDAAVTLSNVEGIIVIAAATKVVLDDSEAAMQMKTRG